MTDDGDDRRSRKKLVHSFRPKNLEFGKDCLFFEKRRKFDFFHRSVPVTKEGNEGELTTAKKSRALILPKNLEFGKDCLFLKNGENLIFFTGPSL